MDGLEETLKKFGAYLLLQKGLMRSTIGTARRILSKALRDMGTTEPSHDEMNVFMLELYDSGASSSHIRCAILVFEMFSKMRGNPITFARPRKDKHIVRESLTEGEITLILAACSTIREHAVLTLLAYSGIRCDELCNVRVSDIDLGAGSMRVRGKGNKERVAFFSGECSKVLQEYLVACPRGIHDYLFTPIRGYRTGLQMTGFGIRKMVRTIAARSTVKKRVHPHIFRHSLATNMLDRGANVISIQEQLGHAHLATTMIYVHSRKSRVEAEYRLFGPRYM